MSNLSLLKKEDLVHRLQSLSEELQELEEEKKYVLKQTGLHLPGHTVKKYESESLALIKSITELKAELERRK
jgi:chromosome condensin MukBEF ATPase and DNA-binding subunit MukB